MNILTFLALKINDLRARAGLGRTGDRGGGKRGPDGGRGCRPKFIF